MIPQKTENYLAFTLVELLATVLVLTFLVLLGLPTLVRAKQKTRLAICQSNLRQLGFALQTYADANDGRLPGPISLLAAARYNHASTNQLAWFLAERLGCSPPCERSAVAPQLVCPGHDGEQEGTPLIQGRTDYVLDDGRNLGGPPFGAAGSVPERPLSLMAIGAVTAPAQSPAIADADKGNVNPTLPGWRALPYQPVHGKIRNQLYFDWHVASKSW